MDSLRRAWELMEIMSYLLSKVKNEHRFFKSEDFLKVKRIYIKSYELRQREKHNWLYNSWSNDVKYNCYH